MIKGKLNGTRDVTTKSNEFTLAIGLNFRKDCSLDLDKRIVGSISSYIYLIVSMLC